jgi:hypothetical protein
MQKREIEESQNERTQSCHDKIAAPKIVRRTNDSQTTEPWFEQIRMCWQVLQLLHDINHRKAKTKKQSSHQSFDNMRIETQLFFLLACQKKKKVTDFSAYLAQTHQERLAAASTAFHRIW